MAKKSKTIHLNYLYLFGMIITVIGFICPLFEFDLGLFGKINSNGFDFIDFKESSFVSIGALLIFIGAVAGIVACFMPMLKNYKLLCLIVTILGGVVLFVGILNSGKIHQSVVKELFRYATFGVYMILAGWVLSLVGYIIKK